jgi:hypothetical protein
VVAAAAVAVVIVGVVVTRGTGARRVTPPIATVTPSSCHLRGALPDPLCTPGVTDPAVTQANLRTTICGGGWSRKVRPPRSYTDDLKRRQIQAYRLDGPSSGYEEDHLIPLALGGSPTDPHNLWPEPGASPNPKDQVEAAAARAVCGRRMALPDAQRAIATDWVALGQRLGVP